MVTTALKKTTKLYQDIQLDILMFRIDRRTREKAHLKACMSAKWYDTYTALSLRTEFRLKRSTQRSSALQYLPIFAGRILDRRFVTR